MENMDPTKVAPVAQTITLEKRDGKVVDSKTGNEYFEKGEDAELEYFVTLLSKGILNVSDIIKKDTTYYSKKMSLEDINFQQKEEKDVDFFVLKYLLGDDDHRVDANYAQNEKGQFSHYDYGRAFSTVVPTKNRLVKSLGNFFFKMEAEHALKKTSNTLNDRMGFAQLLGSKISQFGARLENESFFREVLVKSELRLMTGKFSFLRGDSEKERQEELRKYLQERVSMLLKLTKVS